MTEKKLTKVNSETGLMLDSELIDEVRENVQASKACNTKDAYASDWKIFVKWCEQRNLAPLPATPEILAAFLSAQSKVGIAPPTLVRRCAAIKFRHQSANLKTPTNHILVKSTLHGIKRRRKHVPDKKDPATSDIINKMISHCPNTIAGLRDKALLLIGFGAALRRSELVSLKASDVDIQDGQGLKIIIRHSKTDQEGQGQTVAVPNGRLSIVGVLIDWMEKASIQKNTATYLFPSIKKGGKIQQGALTSRAIANIIKGYASKAGLNIDKFSGHSLRAGFLTSAADNGASIFKMMEVSRHRGMQTVLGYVRNAKLFDNHAGEKFL